MQDAISTPAGVHTADNSKPSDLHAKATAYLNHPGGQMQAILSQMHGASAAGHFETTAPGLSASTVKNLKDMGHEVNQNGSASHTISWAKKLK